MATALGIDNPNSKFNRSRRAPHIPDLPVPLDGQIRVLEFTIREIEKMRTFNYMVGNIPVAKLHAMRLGTKRAELRRVKGGIS